MVNRFNLKAMENNLRVERGSIMHGLQPDGYRVRAGRLVMSTLCTLLLFACDHLEKVDYNLKIVQDLCEKSNLDVKSIAFQSSLSSNNSKGDQIEIEVNFKDGVNDYYRQYPRYLLNKIAFEGSSGQQNLKHEKFKVDYFFKLEDRTYEIASSSINVYSKLDSAALNFIDGMIKNNSDVLNMAYIDTSTLSKPMLDYLISELQKRNTCGDIVNLDLGGMHLERNENDTTKFIISYLLSRHSSLDEITFEFNEESKLLFNITYSSDSDC